MAAPRGARPGVLRPVSREVGAARRPGGSVTGSSWGVAPLCSRPRTAPGWFDAGPAAGCRGGCSGLPGSFDRVLRLSQGPTPGPAPHRERDAVRPLPQVQRGLDDAQLRPRPGHEIRARCCPREGSVRQVSRAGDQSGWNHFRPVQAPWNQMRGLSCSSSMMPPAGSPPPARAYS